MTKTEWEKAFGSVPEDFKNTVNVQLQNIQRKEMPVQKRKVLSVFALACIITLISVIAYATVTGWSLTSFMERWFYAQITEEGQRALQTFASEEYFGENDQVTITLRQALYDGHTLTLLIAATPKNPDVLLLMPLDLLPEDPMCNLGLPGSEQDFTPVQNHGLAKGKTLLGIEPDISIDGEFLESSGHQALEADGTLASWIQLEFSAAPGAEEVQAECTTYLWDKQARPEDMEIQQISFTFPLKVTVLDSDAILWASPR